MSIEQVFEAIKQSVSDVAADMFKINSPIARRFLDYKINDIFLSEEVQKYMKPAKMLLFDHNGQPDIDRLAEAAKDEIKTSGLKIKGIDIKEEWIDMLVRKIHSFGV